jgi:hypothetical protein
LYGGDAVFDFDWREMGMGEDQGHVKIGDMGVVVRSDAAILGEGNAAVEVG